MKLSAPPPPPPPPEQPEPNQQPPDENPPAEATTPPTDSSTPQPAAAALTWPSWFPGADFLLAALAILLAFLLASFAARNSDLWVHLAAGQRLLAGEYRPGTDPFSYSAADRAWVNHSLLFDVGANLLYRGNGTLLVVVKALAVALAFGLLIGIRRSGYSLWPWAAVAVVAVLASAPRFTLSPMVGSMLLLAVTLFLLFRMPHRPGSWRFPIAIGITFWLWANVDSWFIIGPFALALVLVGELIEKKLWKQSEGENPDAEPLGQLPDVPTLAKALGIGIVACMLNPHHVRVWELPFELIGASGLNADFRIRQLLYTPLDSDYSKSTPLGRGLGYNFNGLAYAVLLFGGGAILALGAGRVRLAHVALAVGFALLSLASVYAIPFFALVAVPIIASQLNALTAGVTLKTWGDPKSRFLLLGSAGGRVVCVVATLLACVMAWPGWMHPEVGNAAFARRVAWTVEADPAIVKAAEQLQSWRAEGKLPDDARGVITSLDLANYCAWFAPREKVYVNSRYNLHRPELPGYVALRNELGLLPREEVLDELKLQEQLKSLGVEYVVISTSQADRGTSVGTISQLWMDGDRWSAWYVDGRSTVCGWRSGAGAERPTFAALRVDPVALAFGKGAERLMPVAVQQLPAATGWEHEFVRGVNLPPFGADEAFGWAHYAEVKRRLLQEKNNRIRAVMMTFLLADHVAGNGGVLVVAASSIPAIDPDDEMAAIPFLAIRAARRAIATDPDHADGYCALSIALADPNLPLSPDERVLARVTALRQFLMRVPPPERYKRGAYLIAPSEAARQLGALYLGEQVRTTGQFVGMPANLPAFQILGQMGATAYLVEVGKQFVRIPVPLLEQVPNARKIGGPYLLPLDLAHEAFLKAEQYAAVDSADANVAKRRGEELREIAKVVEAQLSIAKNRYEKWKYDAGDRLKLIDQVQMALNLNLVGEALRILTDKDTDLNKEFERDPLAFALARIALEMATGQLEDAATDLTFRTEEFDTISANPELRQRLRVDVLRTFLRNLTYQKMVLEGNYTEAGAMLDSERLAAGGIGEDPKPTPDQAKVDPAPLVKTAPLLPVLPVIPFLPVPPSLPAVVVPALEWQYKQDLIVRLLRPFLQRQQVLNTRREIDSQFYWRRGLLFLMEGNIPEAKKRFIASRQPGLKEWGVPDRVHTEAEFYLRLIEQAEKTTGK